MILRLSPDWDPAARQLVAEIEADLERREVLKAEARACREEAARLRAEYRDAKAQGNLTADELETLRRRADAGVQTAIRIDHWLRGLS